MNRGMVSWWIRAIVFIAFLYSLVWGILIVAFPAHVFVTSGMETPKMLFAWQLTGVVEIALAIGYLFALKDPLRVWQPILVGVVYKLASVALFSADSALDVSLQPLMGYEVINNLIWVPPFIIILYKAYRRTYLADATMIETLDDSHIRLEMFDASNGQNLKELTDEQPQLVVFLRHFGCTFCREALTDLAQLRSKIESKGTNIVLVHMLEDEEEAFHEISKYGLEDLPAIADPEGLLYKKFRLQRGTMRQLFGIRVWLRGLYIGIVEGHGIGAEKGDYWQMPGVFLMYKGQVIKQFIHHYASDRPEYLDLADCTACE